MRLYTSLFEISDTLVIIWCCVYKMACHIRGNTIVKLKIIRMIVTASETDLNRNSPGVEQLFIPKKQSVDWERSCQSEFMRYVTFSWLVKSWIMDRQLLIVTQTGARPDSPLCRKTEFYVTPWRNEWMNSCVSGAGENVRFACRAMRELLKTQREAKSAPKFLIVMLEEKERQNWNKNVFFVQRMLKIWCTTIPRHQGGVSLTHFLTYAFLC